MLPNSVLTASDVLNLIRVEVHLKPAANKDTTATAAALGLPLSTHTDTTGGGLQGAGVSEVTSYGGMVDLCTWGVDGDSSFYGEGALGDVPGGGARSLRACASLMPGRARQSTYGEGKGSISGAPLKGPGAQPQLISQAGLSVESSNSSSKGSRVRLAGLPLGARTRVLVLKSSATFRHRGLRRQLTDMMWDDSGDALQELIRPRPSLPQSEVSSSCLAAAAARSESSMSTMTAVARGVGGGGGSPTGIRKGVLRTSKGQQAGLGSATASAEPSRVSFYSSTQSGAGDDDEQQHQEGGRPAAGGETKNNEDEDEAAAWQEEEAAEMAERAAQNQAQLAARNATGATIKPHLVHTPPNPPTGPGATGAAPLFPDPTAPAPHGALERVYNRPSHLTPSVDLSKEGSGDQVSSRPHPGPHPTAQSNQQQGDSCPPGAEGVQGAAVLRPTRSTRFHEGSLPPDSPEGGSHQEWEEGAGGDHQGHPGQPPVNQGPAPWEIPAKPRPSHPFRRSHQKEFVSGGGGDSPLVASASVVLVPGCRPSQSGVAGVGGQVPDYILQALDDQDLRDAVEAAEAQARAQAQADAQAKAQAAQPKQPPNLRKSSSVWRREDAVEGTGEGEGGRNRRSSGFATHGYGIGGEEAGQGRTKADRFNGGSNLVNSQTEDGGILGEGPPAHTTTTATAAAALGGMASSASGSKHMGMAARGFWVRDGVFDPSGITNPMMAGEGSYAYTECFCVQHIIRLFFLFLHKLIELACRVS